MTHRPFCDLCGLPVPNNAVHRTASFSDPEKSFRFCCMGCKQVFSMIAELSEDGDPATFKDTELFKQCQTLGIVPRSEADLQNLTAPPKKSLKAEEDINANTLPEDHMMLALKICDMWCPACAWFIETVLRKEQGISTANCNFAIDRLQLAYDPAVTSPAEVISAIKDMGYTAVVPGASEEKKQTRALFVRLMISVLLTANIMMLSFSVYSGFFIELPADAIWKISWPIFIMAAVVVFYGGHPIYQKALANIRSLSFGMETLITTGAFTAFGYSFINLIQGNIHIYFDTASMLITLTLLGKLLEKRIKDRVTSELDTFFNLRPQKARVCSDAYPNGRYTSIGSVVAGDTVQVETEDIIPTDGVVSHGFGYVNEATITGESKLIRKEIGDDVIGGTRVVSDNFSYRVTRIGEDAVLGQMITIMENAVNQKTLVEQYAEKILKWFVPLIILLATGTGGICFLAGLGVEASMMRAVTVMVIACPCALGIAIPLVRVAGISVANSSGILVRNFDAFDHVMDTDTVVFDKTGTLTSGCWELIKILPDNRTTKDQALAIALGLEENSDHDIAVALRNHARNMEICPAVITSIVSHENGISGKMDTKTVKIGSRTFVEQANKQHTKLIQNPIQLEDELYSAVYLSINGQLAAGFVFGDSIRPEARMVISQLRQKKFSLGMVSGDETHVVAKVAEKLEIDTAVGSRLPLDKVDFISRLKAKGHGIIMVGDGINDAPAMASADVGIAITTNRLMRQEDADITLMKEDLTAVLRFLDVSEKVRTKIRQNFWFSFVYNITSIPIAVSGILTPLIAVTAMLCSSLTVIGNTLLLVRKQKIVN